MLRRLILIVFMSLAVLAPRTGFAIQEAGQQAPAPRKDSCAIPFSAFIPDLEKDIKSKEPAESVVRKLALEILATRLKKTKLTAYTRQARVLLVDQQVMIEPESSGEVVSSGIKWKWELKAQVGAVEIFNDAKPAFARFRMGSIRLNISTKDPKAFALVQFVSRPRRWFYIVEGGGKNQDGTVAPKNAPADR